MQQGMQVTIDDRTSERRLGDTTSQTMQFNRDPSRERITTLLHAVAHSAFAQVRSATEPDRERLPLGWTRAIDGSASRHVTKP
jgi:hypothetical protein